jgi:iron complex outermembrane recepter protein
MIRPPGNAASATSKGIEGSLTIRPLRNFDITATGAYQDIKYDDYPHAACLVSQPQSVCDPAIAGGPPPGQTVDPIPNSIYNNNLAGYTPPYTSKWTGSIQAHVRFDLGSLKLDTTGVAAGRSGYFDSDDQSPLYGYQPGYVKYDMRVQLSSQNDSWHIAFVGKNLSNKLTTGSAFLLPYPITGVTHAITYVEPGRTLALEAGVKF